MSAADPSLIGDACKGMDSLATNAVDCSERYRSRELVRQLRGPDTICSCRVLPPLTLNGRGAEGTRLLEVSQPRELCDGAYMLQEDRRTFLHGIAECFDRLRLIASQQVPLSHIEVSLSVLIGLG